MENHREIFLDFLCSRYYDYLMYKYANRNQFNLNKKYAHMGMIIRQFIGVTLGFTTPYPKNGNYQIKILEEFILFAGHGY